MFRAAAVIAALCFAAPPVIEELKLGGDTSPFTNAEVQTDLPQQLRKRNIASRGLGCCVFRSIEHSADYQNCPALNDFAEWMVKTNIPGGGYPSKASDLIERIAKDRGVPTPRFVQITNGDMEFLRQALKTGRMPAVTYDGRDPFYGPRSRIAHMVNLVYLNETEAAILDNNNPNKLMWMSADEFKSRWLGNSGGWSLVLLSPTASPPPRN